MGQIILVEERRLGESRDFIAMDLDRFNLYDPLQARYHAEILKVLDVQPGAGLVPVGCTHLEHQWDVTVPLPATISDVATIFEDDQQPRIPDRVDVGFGSVSLSLLGQQRAWLANYRTTHAGENEKMVEGLISLLDAIADQVEAEIQALQQLALAKKGSGNAVLKT